MTAGPTVCIKGKRKRFTRQCMCVFIWWITADTLVLCVAAAGYPYSHGHTFIVSIFIMIKNTFVWHPMYCIWRITHWIYHYWIFDILCFSFHVFHQKNIYTPLFDFRKWRNPSEWDILCLRFFLNDGWRPIARSHNVPTFFPHTNEIISTIQYRCMQEKWFPFEVNTLLNQLHISSNP